MEESARAHYCRVGLFFHLLGLWLLSDGATSTYCGTNIPTLSPGGLGVIIYGRVRNGGLALGGCFACLPVKPQAVRATQQRPVVFAVVSEANTRESVRESRLDGGNCTDVRSI